MMSSLTLSTIGRVSTAALVLGLVACQGEAPTAADSARTPIAFALDDTPPPSDEPTLGQITICKAGNADGTFTVSNTPFNGSTPMTSGSPVNVPKGTCKVVVVDMSGSGSGSNTVITETSAGFVSASARLASLAGEVTTYSDQPYTNGSTPLLANAFHGFRVTYTNNVIVPPPPPSGNLGCSPGYYKNHALPTGFTSSTTFASVFGNDVYGTKTLIQVLSTGGGGLAALGRQTVAAYFNAGIYADFGYTPAEVISAFNTAVAGSAADQNTLKNTFEALTDVDGRICTNPTGK